MVDDSGDVNMERESQEDRQQACLARLVPTCSHEFT